MSETMVVAFLGFLVLGAMAFYFYARIMYTEKKIGLLESVLLDIKMTMETEAAPTNWTGGAKKMKPMPEEEEAPAPAAETETNEIVTDVAYYNSVLADASTDLSGTEAVVDASEEDVAEVDYDAMNRDELGALAEKRGLRVTKRMTKSTVVNLLREADKNSSVTQESGKDVVEGSNSSLGGIESLDGGAPLDIEADVQV